jgi:hypothetical protein
MSTWIELIPEPMRPEMMRLDLYNPGIRDFLPVAIVCGISILLTALWLLAVMEYTWLKNRHMLRQRDGCKTGE